MTDRRQVLISIGVLVLAGCEKVPISTTDVPPDPAPAGDLVIVNKVEGCPCCVPWANHMQNAGFTVELRNLENLKPLKARVGVPTGMCACHTAEVGGYFVEGHVPAADVRRLLRERPAAKGLVVPGRPIGAPGMEVSTGEIEPYTVFLVAMDGSTVVYARYGS